MLTSKPSLLDRLKAGVQKTRAGLMEKLEDAISGRKEIDTDVLDELEYALITADIGTATTAGVVGLGAAAEAAAGDPSFLNNVPDELLAGHELPTFKFALEKSEGKVVGGSSGKGLSRTGDLSIMQGDSG